MAAFVKSVEEVTVSFTSTAGLQLQTAALTKSQDPAKCVPFITARFTSTGSPRVTRNNLVSVEIVDDGGTPTVEARRNGSGTVGAMTCVIYIVEFADAVTVQKGTLTKSGTSATAAISSVNQGNSFLAFNYHAGAGSAGASAEVATALGFFASNTQIEFNRAFRTDYDLEIAWYVVESNGTDFNVEYIEYNYGSSETGPTNVALSNSVSLGNSFIVPNFELFDYTDRVRDWAFNWALTGTSQITFYRNSGTPNRSGTAGVFVVRSNAAGVNTQRLDTDVGSTPTTNETVTAVDTDKAVLIAGGHVSSFSTFSPTSDIAGNDLWRHSTTLDLTSTTNVQLQRNSQDLAGPNNIARYELVEFEIDTAGPPQTVPVGLVSEADTVQAVAPVAGAVSVAVGIVSEADSVLEVAPIPGAVSVAVNIVSEADAVFVVTPEVGGAPQTVPVGLASETDSILGVTPLAGEVTLPVALVTETDTVFAVDPVITKAPQTVSVGLVAEADDVLGVTILPGGVTLLVGEVTELDQVAPVFPVLEGGPQTVLVINISEVDTVFPVTPRVPTIGSRNQEEDFFIGIRIGI